MKNRKLTVCSSWRRENSESKCSPSSFDTPYGLTGSGQESSNVGVPGTVPYTAELLANTRRDTPWRTQASSTFQVPVSARLKRLEDAGVVDKQIYQANPPRAEYVLTDRGRKLADVVNALYDWGEAHTAAPAGK